ncbi:uncharacterized protein LOC117103706 [Anneissia japonica]|uniref:uncharacterized protein LOC117103706 n=1 Tax=Anneissia japonica TaxID=1529436 RepID=UPI00142555DB|nr:uncharacterized protein LOC117103706 [Anneissia japonica]
MSAEEVRAHQVKLYVYDLTKGIARSMSQAFLGKQLDGIWHTSIVVFAREYFYGGGGIESCRPCGTILGNPDSVLDLGETYLDYPLFYEYMSNLREEMFCGEKYNLFEHNCNTFSNEVAQFLTGNEIPDYITGLPQEILTTPLGALIKPLIDSMSANPIRPRTNEYLEPVPQPSYLQDTDQSQASAASAIATDNDNKDQVKTDGTSTLNGADPDPAINGVSDPAVADIKASEGAAISDSKSKLPVVSKKQLFTDAKPGECVQCILENVPDGILSPGEKDSLNALRKYLDEEMDLTGIPNDGFLALCNICKWGQGFSWLISDREWTLNGVSTQNSKITCALLTPALLCDNLEIIEAAGTLVNNLAQHAVPEDMAIELGSALIQCLTTMSEVTEGAAFFCLGGLYGLMQHGEVTCLTSVMGLDPQKFAARSQRLEILCGDMHSVMQES